MFLKKNFNDFKIIYTPVVYLQASAQCVARRSWIQRTTSKLLSNCIDWSFYEL